MNSTKNYKDYIEDASRLVNSEGTYAFNKANALMAISLSMVVGELKHVIEKSNKKIGELNASIEKYSESSDKHASAMKWLTAGLFFIGIIQALIVIFSF